MPARSSGRRVLRRAPGVAPGDARPGVVRVERGGRAPRRRPRRRRGCAPPGEAGRLREQARDRRRSRPARRLTPRPGPPEPRRGRGRRPRSRVPAPARVRVRARGGFALSVGFALGSGSGLGSGLRLCPVGLGVWRRRRWGSDARRRRRPPSARLAARPRPRPAVLRLSLGHRLSVLAASAGRLQPLRPAQPRFGRGQPLRPAQPLLRPPRLVVESDSCWRLVEPIDAHPAPIDDEVQHRRPSRRERRSQRRLEVLVGLDAHTGRPVPLGHHRPVDRAEVGGDRSEAAPGLVVAGSSRSARCRRRGRPGGRLRERPSRARPRSCPGRRPRRARRPDGPARQARPRWRPGGRSPSVPAVDPR